MHSATLIQSWREIWLATLRGDSPAQVRAINKHVEIFPRANRDDVLRRTQRTVIDHRNDPAAIRAFLERGERTLELTRVKTRLGA